MRKVALVFVLAVLAPSLVLAWLAVRSLRDQQLILERQRYLLCQGEADKLAEQAGNFLLDQQTAFRNQVESLISAQSALAAARPFDTRLRAQWPLARIGFVVTTNGALLCPSPKDSPEAQNFCELNAKFLGNLETAPVFLNNYNTKIANASGSQQWRNVVPQQQGGSQGDDAIQLSKFTCSAAEFRQLMGDALEGALARFLDNKLDVMFWYRSPRDPKLIFGAQLDPVRLREGLARLPAAEELAPPLQQEICLAVLDDAAKPVGLSRPGFAANWKKPFVATEIGETLPHWEAAVYIIDPGALSRTAESLKFTLGLLIAVLVTAIGVGGWLVLHCVKSELVLARQKTDFVSNVSHELKTPLTSIRMFAELLSEGRVADAAKQHSYLNIITAEASRLTRLINNVLDFSRLERGEKKYQFQPCDLAEVARAAVQTFRPHLEAAGFKFDCALPAMALPVQGDADALSQIIVNLLSNAEKYSNGRKEIVLEAGRAEAPIGVNFEKVLGIPGISDSLAPRSGERVRERGIPGNPLSPALSPQAGRERKPGTMVKLMPMGQAPAPQAEIKVLDRGSGVPRGSEERIFEKFYRAHNSLSSGIEGSGLGLTIARHIARAHGGEVSYEPREGGGSCFRLRIPLSWPPA